MNKKIIGLALLLALVSSTYAIGKEMTFGVKGGLNYNACSLSVPGYDLSDGVSTSSAKAEGKIGYSGGAFIEYPLSDQLSIQGELLYNFLNVKYKNSISSSNSTIQYTYDMSIWAEINTTYIDIPILLKYQISDELTVFGGGQYSTILTAKTKVGSSVRSTLAGVDVVNTSTENAEEDIKNDIDNSYSLVLGGSYNFNPNFLLDVRFILGLKDIAKPDDAEIKPWSWAFTLAYKF